MGAFIDLTGQQFNRLTVIERAENYVSPKGVKQTQWLCQCECGNTVIVTAQKLKSGSTKSCGCYIHDKVTKHGMWKSRIYSIWRNIKCRCNNPNATHYDCYGGRGITVCNEWRQSFQAFYDWAMANGYKDGLTIDRIDNNKGYSPDNCRWVSMKMQSNNTRATHIIEFNGERHSISEWAEKLEINKNTLSNRILRGWNIEKALTQSVHHNP
jgi:hypothetical protein